MKIKFLYIIIFYLYNKFYIKCDSCSQYTDCFNCTMCGDETSKSCNCYWGNLDGNYICKTKTSSDSIYLSEWYVELNKCDDDIVQDIYCSGEDTVYTRDDLDSQQSITFQINNDNKKKYGKNMLFCYYNYMDETSNDYILNIEFANSIKNKPKVVCGCKFTDNNEDKIQKIEENKEINCLGSYKIFFFALLKDEYTKSPLSFKITLNNSSNSKYVAIFSIVVTILLLITCIICCITRFYNNKARRQLRLLMNQRARENMIIIAQENNNMNNYNDNLENIEEINREKLNILFSKKMAEHTYKSEYNQYGGGCSICLEEFKKKDRVSMTPCNHVFHHKCIKDWLYKNIKNPKCPNCNKEVLVEEENTIKEKTMGTQVIKVKKRQNNNNNILYNNLNFAGRNSIATNVNNRRGTNNVGGRGDSSQSQRQYLGDY